MSYISVREAAKIWNLSERSVRNYCKEGRVTDAIFAGGVWLIPAEANKPERQPRKSKFANLYEALIMERRTHIKGGIYHLIQIELTYNSNHMEGSCLSEDQTRMIFETHTISNIEGAVDVDDILEATNHFRCIDFIIDNANKILSESMIKKLHGILKNGTSQSFTKLFSVGDYKKIANYVDTLETASPKEVPQKMRELLIWYNSLDVVTLKDILKFHVTFERIHPFVDGNGRVGRLIIFKECLKHNIVPFIITDELKMFYYNGLRKWHTEQGFLLGTCETAQDELKKHLDYLGIPYQC
mgnify:CR=1 FL=1